MPRTFHARGVLVTFALLTAACTTISPAASPSPAATASATASETPVPTGGLIASPLETAATTDGPTRSISPDSTFLFADDFDADAGGWGTADLGDAGKIEWADGALQFTTGNQQPQGSLQSTKPLSGAPWEEIAATGRFTATQGEGTLMGFYCRAGAEDLVGGVITADGNWAVLAGTTGSVAVTAQGALPEGSVALGQEAQISIQCSVASATAPNMVRLGVGESIVTTTEIPAEQASIEAFDTLGLWIEPIVPPMAVTVDGIEAVGRHEPRRENPAP